MTEPVWKTKSTEEGFLVPHGGEAGELWLQIPTEKQHSEGRSAATWRERFGLAGPQRDQRFLRLVRKFMFWVDTHIFKVAGTMVTKLASEVRSHSDPFRSAH